MSCRPPTALSSNAGTVGHADVVVEGEAKPLPGGFEEQLVAFEDFEKVNGFIVIWLMRYLKEEGCPLTVGINVVDSQFFQPVRCFA